MKSRDFCYWLQGYFELVGATQNDLTAEQTETIKKHLSMVFLHEIDASFPDDEQGPLSALHNPEMIQGATHPVQSTMRC